MKVEKALKVQQSDIGKKSKENNKNKSKRGKRENLSFSDVMELMKHRSYKRVRGALRQK